MVVCSSTCVELSFCGACVSLVENSISSDLASSLDEDFFKRGVTLEPIADPKLAVAPKAADQACCPLIRIFSPRV